MKKLLFLTVAMLSTAAVFGQRISTITTVDAKTLGFAALNPTNNSTEKTGKAFPVFAPGADLTNVTLNIDCGTASNIVEPTTLPTDWSSAVRIKLQNDGTVNTNWALYDVVCRTIKPAALPLTGLFSDGSPLISEWSTSTEGWAPLALEENLSFARVGSAKRGFLLAFTDAPETLSYTISLANTVDVPATVFDVEESIDGSSWTSVITYTGTGKEPNQMPLSNYLPGEKIRTQTLLPTTRFVRFIFTTRDKGNVTVQDLSVTKSEASSIDKVEVINRLMVQGSELVINASETIAQVEVVNLNGQVVKRVVSPEGRINIGELAGGCYIAKVVSDKGNVSAARFVK